jgi:WD40 repeat protein
MKAFAVPGILVGLLCFNQAWPEAIAWKDDNRLVQTAVIRADRFGDPLPQGASARLGALRFRHGDSVLVAAYAPDGKSIASLGHDQCIRFWDTATGKQLHYCELKLGPLWFFGKYALEFTGDGQLLAIGAHRSVALLPVRAGGKPRYFPEQDEDVHGLGFAPGAKLLAVFGSSQTISLRDTASGKETRRLGGHTEGVLAAAFSADGSTLASAGKDHVIRLWHVGDGKEIRKASTSARIASRLAFARDGRRLAWADERGTVHVLDVAAGREIDAFLVCPGEPYDDYPIGSLRFTADGILEAWGTDPPTLCLWQAGKALQRRAFEHLSGKAPYGRLAPDGKSAVCWAENSPMLRFLDVASGREREFAPGHWRKLSSLTVSSRGEFIASAGGDHTVRLWDVRNCREFHRWQTPGIGSPFVSFAPDGKVLASCVWDGEKRLGTIRFWDVASGRELRRFQTEANRYLAFSGDGKVLFSAGRCTVQAWDAAQGKLIRTMQELAEAKEPPYQIDAEAPFQFWEIAAFAATADSKLVAAIVEQAAKERFYLWEATTGKRVPGWSDKGLEAPIAFSPDGQMLAAVKHRKGMQYDVVVWEVSTGRERMRIPLKEQGCESIAFSPDGKRLVIGNRFDGAVHLWSIVDRKEVACLRGPEGPVLVVFSHDGKALISGAADATLLVWDLQGLTPSPAP